MSKKDIQTRIQELIAENRVKNADIEDEDLEQRLQLGKNKGTTRTFRDEPFAWWEKKALRYLRKKYGASAKTKR